ncbi:hypothetical protein WN55_06510 [Dufourea novaeangliae]|uniref:Peptidase S1 domain-containing protein n=1 Tax=Dufourea novaeangliae TaxID=178035 RepID=A0A154PS92_DUFNO|nr:hypothetical protein WN55_06510 [Dufourea novaeangliae]
MLRKFAEKFYIHEKYNASDSWVNDIALIKVITPFDKSSLISPVPMPSSADIAKANDRAIVSGFGRLAVNITLNSIRN